LPAAPVPEGEAAGQTFEAGGIVHAILDLLDELREKHRPADCVSRKRIGAANPPTTFK